MPYKSEAHAIKDPFLDRRTKLLPCQKEMVLYWHNAGLSTGKIAKMFTVSKRLIQFVIDPDKKKKNIERREERGGSAQYYNRSGHALAMRKHRRHKDNIYNKITGIESDTQG